MQDATTRDTVAQDTVAQEKVEQWLGQLTLEEKAGLCSGADTWHTKAVERLGIPAVMMCDGPHGLRKQVQAADHLGLNASIEAVCFPAACASACSFDRALLREMGEALGDECRAEGVSLLLGPGANLKRSPLCGRNFEYFSEDPYAASEMAAAWITGLQSRGVGASLKHYLANNQETRRMTVNASIAPRPLRELYLAAFEGAVRKARPHTVMCSYNRLNGTYVSEDPFALTEVLRGDWGFEGFVVSDWGAVNERVAALAAGMDLEMPSSNGVNDAEIVAAVREGRLDEAVLDRAVARILEAVARWSGQPPAPAAWDKEAHHALARKIAAESMVLLKNEGVLPLAPKGRVAFIGPFAKTPRYQGSGSSFINAFRVTGALEAAGQAGVAWAEGCSLEEDARDEALLGEAVQAAREAEVAVVFAGLPDTVESEGYDRDSLDLPANQNRLITEIAKVQPNLVVVLHGGAPVAMPWLGGVKAVLEAYLGGQAVGAAVCDVLFGAVNPSGKLAESFPKRLEDSPSFLNFPGEGDEVDYAEGLYVGYRYYDKKRTELLFPFGHGLSYTSFAYEDIRLSVAEMQDTGALTVTVALRNTGPVAGKEVVQLYVAEAAPKVARPEKELKGFEKILLQPGQRGEVTFTLGKRAFAHWDEALGDWVAGGVYHILVGGSSAGLPLRAAVTVHSTAARLPAFHLNSTLGEVLPTPAGQALLQPRIDAFVEKVKSEPNAMGAGGGRMLQKMIGEMPLRGLIGFSGGAVSREMLQMLVDALNEPPEDEP